MVGYGGVGGARAIETLRGAVIELQMTPIWHEVNIAMRSSFLGILQNGRSLLNDYWLSAVAKPGGDVRPLGVVGDSSTGAASLKVGVAERGVAA